MGEEQRKFKVKKKKLGSYPYLSVIFSISLALFTIGIFGTLIIYSKELERVVRENVKVQVYLKNLPGASQRSQIEKNIASKPYVAATPGSIIYISKEQAADQFIKETGEDFKKFLGDNPLRDAFLVKIKAEYQDPENLRKIKNEIEKIGGVFEVFYVESVIDSINKNITKIGLVLLGLAALLVIVVVLLINNTLRLALFSQRFLIRSMQLVGAKRTFIQQPFLIRASVHGFIAGVISIGFLILLIQTATRKIEDLSLIQNNERLLMLAGALLILGVLIALVSTYRAVSKYLKLSLDELY